MQFTLNKRKRVKIKSNMWFLNIYIYIYWFWAPKSQHNSVPKGRVNFYINKKGENDKFIPYNKLNFIWKFKILNNVIIQLKLQN